MNEISSDLPSDVAASDVVTDDKINNPAKSIELKITALENDMRLDRFIRQHYPSIGHSQIEKWLRTRHIRLNGGRVKSAYHVKSGDIIRLPLSIASEADEAVPNKADGEPRRLSLDEKTLVEHLHKCIIYRDEQVLVINKPCGLAVQGGTGLAISLAQVLDSLRFDAPTTPLLVHRLDKDTSGCLVLARNRQAAKSLSMAFQRRDAYKDYWALVRGVPKPMSGKVDCLLAKEGPIGQEKMRVISTEDKHTEDKHTWHGEKDTVRAITTYEVVEFAGGEAAWLLMQPQTGRTHQLRVHAAYLGHPIIGDGKYGGDRAFLPGSFSRKLHLHAHSIDIAHPNGGRLQASATLPLHMENSWKFFGFSKKLT